MVAVVGAIGVALVGVIGNTLTYSWAYAVLGVLAVIAVITILIVDDKLVGRNL
jgi:hypothetical protein